MRRWRWIRFSWIFFRYRKKIRCNGGSDVVSIYAGKMSVRFEAEIPRYVGRAQAHSDAVVVRNERGV